MSCTTCSGIFEAKPVLTSDEDIQKYREQLDKLNSDGMLPDLEKQLQYKVYSIKAGGFCGHKSIVLSSNDIHFVTVELGFCEKNGETHVSPVTRALAKTNQSKLKYHGKVKKTGNQLIDSALDVMKKFGSYNKLCRNCHDYCRMFLEANGLSDE